MITAFEERSLNAWPSTQTVLYDGWILRFSERYTRRANSINPLYGSSLPLAQKIDYCERLYTWKGQDTVFKMTECVQPSDLDAELSGRGYADDAHTSVQTASLEGLSLAPLSEAVLLADKLTDSWLDAFLNLSNIDTARREIITRMLNAIVPERCFAALHDNGETIAVGLGVLEQGYVGLFDIVTAAPARNRGFGRKLVGNLLAWGKMNGAHSGSLQVMLDNAPALHLYASFGFQEIYRYWYRVKRQNSVR